jgi:hypothetical protein
MTNRTKRWTLGILVAGLLVLALASLMGNLLAGTTAQGSPAQTAGATCPCLAQGDADGDGIPNGQDADFVCPETYPCAGGACVGSGERGTCTGAAQTCPHNGSGTCLGRGAENGAGMPCGGTQGANRSDGSTGGGSARARCPMMGGRSS